MVGSPVSKFRRRRSIVSTLSSVRDASRRIGCSSALTPPTRMGERGDGEDLMFAQATSISGRFAQRRRQRFTAPAATLKGMDNSKFSDAKVGHSALGGAARRRFWITMRPARWWNSIVELSKWVGSAFDDQWPRRMRAERPGIRHLGTWIPWAARPRCRWLKNGKWSVNFRGRGSQLDRYDFPAGAVEFG